MQNNLLKASVLALTILAPAAAFAQNSGTNGGALSGAAAGAVGGAVVGGPVGAAVGGAAGLVGGAVVGSLSNDDRVYAKRYVTEHREPSVRYENELRVGETLPGTVTYYEIQGRPALSGYRYTVVNDRAVLVEPKTRKIVEVID